MAIVDTEMRAVDPSASWWASDVVNKNGGMHNVTLPTSLPAGEYLVREFGSDSSQRPLGD